MKPYIFYLATLLILPFSGNTLAQNANLAPADITQVETVINQYCAALAGGDVATLENVLGGRLKAKRMPLLNNPEYAAYLATAHMNASFKVLDMHSTAPNMVSVDVLVTYSPDESIRKTYTLKRNASGNASEPPYRIISESAAGN